MGKRTPPKHKKPQPKPQQKAAKLAPARKPVKTPSAKPTKTADRKKAPVVKKDSHTRAPRKEVAPAKHPAPAKARPQAKPAPAKAKPPPAQPQAKAKPAKPAPAPKSAPAKPPPAANKKAAAPAAPAPAAKLSADELRKQLITKARSRTKAVRAPAFTLDDVRGELARSTTRTEARNLNHAGDDGGPRPGASASHGSRLLRDKRPERRHLEAASLADILGYNPVVNERPADEEQSIDKRFVKYYRLLVQLRDHVNSGLALHTEDTLKRSNREDSGDLSGYGQHMADAGTDNFDRDFALSLVSNEQEALFEIEEAIKRIRAGTYGNCELTGKPIAKDRLLAVPFARYSVESQTEIEKMKRRSSQRSGVFADATGEEGSKFIEEEAE
jgi:RNA polymerase-binding transcription factor DksA